MPTLAEMELLNRSLGDLGDTFYRNRLLREQERERAARAGLEREAMGQRREELDLRREDAADARRTRQLGLEAQTAHQQRLENYQKQLLAARDDEQKMAIFRDMLKSGTANQETLDAMSRALSQKLGVEVKLKMPERPDRMPRPFAVGNQKGIYNPETGNFEVDKPRPAGRRTIKLGDPMDPNAESITQDLTAEEMEKLLRRDLLETSGGSEAELPELRSQTGLMGRARDFLLNRVVPGRATRSGSIAAERDVQAAVESGDAVPAGGPPSGAASRVAPPVYQSETEARAAGHKAGDIVRLLLNGQPTRVRLK